MRLPAIRDISYADSIGDSPNRRRTTERPATKGVYTGVQSTMSLQKRSKRDRTTRAWQRGYQAGLIGRSQDTCPHQEMGTRTSWIDGWTQGHQDQADGSMAIGGLHKRPI